MLFKDEKDNVILLVISLLFLSCIQTAKAGFGISPPYVYNDSLIRNSYYEEKIYLGRAEAEQEVKIEITKNVPGANDWISIDKGESFILPKGKKQVPIAIGVRVPGDAEFGSYKGDIKVRVVPTRASGGGGVSVVLGAQIDVDFEVLDKVIYDFKVWRVRIFDLEEGHKLWWLFFPGRLKFQTEIENLGNIEAAPSKISLKIYGNKGEGLLETLETTEIEKINPFSTEQLSVEFPTKLPAGAYTANFEIFKGEGDAIKKGKLPVTVLPYGTLPDYKGYGFSGLDLFDKASLVLVIIACLSVSVFIAYKTYRFFKRRKKKKS